MEFGAWQATIQNESGDIIPGAQIDVIVESTGLPATIYSGRTGGVLSNPFFADANGFAQFYADADNYRVTATQTSSGFTNTWRYVEVGALEAALSAGKKNYLINGDMTVDQRQNSPLTTNGFSADRWFHEISNLSDIQIVQNAGGTAYMQVNAVAGTDVLTASQRIESPLVFNNKTLTLSFNVFGSTDNFQSAVYLRHSTGEELLAITTHASPSGDISWTFNVGDISGYTFNADSYLDIRVMLIFSPASSGVYGLQRIQLEEGITATPIEYVSPQEQLSACQRYYWRGAMVSDGFGYLYGGAGDTGMLAAQVTFPTTMRGAAAADIITPPAYINCGNGSLILDSTQAGMGLRVDVTATGRFRAASGIYEADAEL